MQTVAVIGSQLVTGLAASTALSVLGTFFTAAAGTLPLRRAAIILALPSTALVMAILPYVPAAAAKIL